MKDVARFFTALADEARLKILWLLFNHRELCVCDIMEALAITQSKASRHLRTLAHAGLVTDRREKTWSYYSLRRTDDVLQRNQLAALRKSLAGHPGAAQALHDLRTWLKRKKSSGACPAPERNPRKRGNR